MESTCVSIVRAGSRVTVKNTTDDDTFDIVISELPSAYDPIDDVQLVNINTHTANVLQGKKLNDHVSWLTPTGPCQFIIKNIIPARNP